MEQLNPMQVVGADRFSTPSKKCDPGWLADKMKILFSAYRLDDYPDPKGFMVQMGMVLENYDPQIVAYVTSPLTGIQRKSKFPPSIAEVVSACVDAKIELAEAERRRNEPVRVVEKIVHDPIPPGQGYEEMVAKHGKPVGRFE